MKKKNENFNKKKSIHKMEVFSIDEFLYMLNKEQNFAVITDHRLVNRYKANYIEYLFYCADQDKFIWIQDTVNNKDVRKQIEYYKQQLEIKGSYVYYLKEDEHSNVLKRILKIEKCNNLLEEEFHDINFHTNEQAPWYNKSSMN